MTRINSAIKPSLLTDEHLLAEHREIKRLVFNYLTRKTKHSDLGKIPDKFVLGTGHVSFFLNKGKFTHIRYIQLHNECVKRGFSVENYSDNWNSIDNRHFNDYEPSIEEYHLLKERITERLMGTKKKNWRYYGKPITKEDSVNLLNGYYQ
jgi:hypothetical protein